MKAYATLALVFSMLVLFWSVLAAANVGDFRMRHAIPYIVIYAAGMFAFAVASFFYVRKMERRRLSRRRW